MIIRNILPTAAISAIAVPASTTVAEAAAIDLTDPVSALNPHFSQFLDRTDEDGDVEPSVERSATRSSSNGGELTIDPALEVIPEISQGTTGLTLHGQSHGYTVLSNENEDRADFVRADEAGASVLHIASSASAAADITLEFPEGIDEAKSQESFSRSSARVFLDNGDGLTLREPIVRDSDGAYLNASYELEGNNVRVIVPDSDLSDASYPLVAASGLEYIMDFKIGDTGPYAAREEMHKDGQFNDIFPVAGAPENFPEKGDLLPLRVPFEGLGLNFECIMGDEASFGSDGEYLWGYNFLATENHIDGEGSSIRFEIANYDIDSVQQNDLYVHGVVVNDNPGNIPNAIYKAEAHRKWQEFADNLADLSR